MKNQRIFTIGYSLFHKGADVDLDDMFNALREYHVSYLVDVRSVPYSKNYPGCSKDNLKSLGKSHNIPYTPGSFVKSVTKLECDI